MDEDPFSSEERIAAASATLSIMDALDDEDLQAAAIEVRDAAFRYRALLVELGVSPKAAALSTVGAVFGQFLPADDDADTPLPN